MNKNGIIYLVAIQQGEKSIGTATFEQINEKKGFLRDVKSPEGTPLPDNDLAKVKGKSLILRGTEFKINYSVKVSESTERGHVVKIEMWKSR